MKNVMMIGLTLLASTSAFARNCEVYTPNSAAQSQCYLQEFRDADETLNSTYQSVMVQLGKKGDAALKNAVVTDEKNWISQKEIECDRQSQAGASTSEKQILWRKCAINMTVERTNFLGDNYLGT